MPKKICLIRHNSTPPHYYPDARLLYNLVNGILYDRDGTSYNERCYVCPESLDSYLSKEGVTTIIASIDFTNCDEFARIQTNIPLLLVIGDTHHGRQPITRVRHSIMRYNIISVLLAFVPWHARLFTDIADVYYIEGLCPNTDMLVAHSDLPKDEDGSGGILLTGSIGSTHHRRRLLFDMLMSMGSINGKRVMYCTGDIGRLAEEYRRACVSINCPICVDINQRHWEILASGGIPLFLPPQRLALHTTLEYVTAFIPPTGLVSRYDQVAWSIENLHLSNVACDAKKYIRLLGNTAKAFLEGLCNGYQTPSKGIRCLKWQKEVDTMRDEMLLNDLIAEVEQSQVLWAMGIEEPNFGKLDKLLSSASCYSYSTE